MKIWKYEVGPGHPVFVVGEGGSNHGGSLDAALALTDAAAEAGANAMKWQLWTSADEMYDREQFPQEWETTQKYRLPVEWLPQLRDRAHERGMAFGLSSFGFASLDEADKWVDFHKVASIEAQWSDFVVRVVAKNKPTLISTGGDNGDAMKLVTDTLWTCGLINFHSPNLIFLQCALAYPCPIEDADIAAVYTMRLWSNQNQRTGEPMKNRTQERFGVGYSDHTLHPTIAPCAAVALGACVVEKHLRLDDVAMFEACDWINMDTPPDWEHSIEPYDFTVMVSAIRMTEQALGSSEKRIRPSEEPYLKYRRGPKGLRGA